MQLALCVHSNLCCSRKKTKGKRKKNKNIKKICVRVEDFLAVIALLVVVLLLSIESIIKINHTAWWRLNACKQHKKWNILDDFWYIKLYLQVKRWNGLLFEAWIRYPSEMTAILFGLTYVAWWWDSEITVIAILGME